MEVLPVADEAEQQSNRTDETEEGLLEQLGRFVEARADRLAAFRFTPLGRHRRPASATQTDVSGFIMASTAIVMASRRVCTHSFR